VVTGVVETGVVDTGVDVDTGAVGTGVVDTGAGLLVVVELVDVGAVVAAGVVATGVVALDWLDAPPPHAVNRIPAAVKERVCAARRRRTVWVTKMLLGKAVSVGLCAKPRDNSIRQHNVTSCCGWLTTRAAARPVHPVCSNKG
jgi:hypothetical protein